jgi:hypothetical protein
MSKFAGYDIKFEASDEKGMINVNAMMDFFPKAIKAVCEICVSTNKFGSGFFCKIPYTQNNNLLLPVLITNNHVLSKNELESDLKIIINGETKIISLKGRKKWTDETIDFTCIEIKEEEDNIHTFYNLDDNVYDKNYSNDCYLNNHVIIFAINKNDKQVGFSNGVIKQNEKSFFAYTCNTFKGCSGGCIVNQNNNNIIGIHKGEINTSNEKAVNVGIYINNVINYIKQSKEKISEKVNIIL